MPTSFQLFAATRTPAHTHRRVMPSSKDCRGFPVPNQSSRNDLPIPQNTDSRVTRVFFPEPGKRRPLCHWSQDQESPPPSCHNGKRINDSNPTIEKDPDRTRNGSRTRTHPLWKRYSLLDASSATRAQRWSSSSPARAGAPAGTARFHSREKAGITSMRMRRGSNARTMRYGKRSE